VDVGLPVELTTPRYRLLLVNFNGLISDRHNPVVGFTGAFCCSNFLSCLLDALTVKKEATASMIALAPPPLCMYCSDEIARMPLLARLFTREQLIDGLLGHRSVT
jgi:hypothetical protein